MGWWMASGEMVSRQTIKLEIGVDVVDDDGFVSLHLV